MMHIIGTGNSITLPIESPRSTMPDLLTNVGMGVGFGAVYGSVVSAWIAPPVGASADTNIYIPSNICLSLSPRTSESDGVFVNCGGTIFIFTYRCDRCLKIRPASFFFAQEYITRGRGREILNRVVYLWICMSRRRWAHSTVSPSRLSLSPHSPR